MDNILDNYIKLTIDADNALGGRLCKVEYGGTSYYKSLNVYGDVSFYLPPLPVAYRGNANIYIGTSAASQSSWETQTDNRGNYLTRTVCLGSGDNLTVYFSMSHDYRPADREDLYTNIPTASNSQKGVVTVDTDSPNSVGLEMSGSDIRLKSATTTVKGGIYVGNGLQANSGVLSLVNATDSQLGGMRVGNGLSASSGIVSLVNATSSQLGGIKVGTGLKTNSGTVSVQTGKTYVLVFPTSAYVTLDDDIKMQSITLESTDSSDVGRFYSNNAFPIGIDHNNSDADYCVILKNYSATASKLTVNAMILTQNGKGWSGSTGFKLYYRYLY